MNILQKATVLTVSAIALSLTGLSAQAGPMSGSGSYKASGSAKVSGNAVKLGSNFRFSGGPDVYVAVKRKGKKMRLIGKLRKNSGAQSYKLPSGTKKADVEKILLWCKRYNVQMGSANPN